MMIDYNDLGVLRGPPHPCHEAFLEMSAPRADARLTRRRHFPPYGCVLRQVREFRAIPRFGLAQPFADPEKMRIGPQCTARASLLESATTDVVGESLHQCGAQNDAHGRREPSRQSGRSFSKSCSSRARVAVDTITLRPLRTAGTRYASVFPVPVPASTRRCVSWAEGVLHRLRHGRVALAKLPAVQGPARGANLGRERRARRPSRPHPRTPTPPHQRRDRWAARHRGSCLTVSALVELPFTAW